MTPLLRESEKDLSAWRLPMMIMMIPKMMPRRITTRFMTVDLSFKSIFLDPGKIRILFTSNLFDKIP